MLPLATTSVKSYKEERRGPTELAECLHLAIFYSEKSKEMCKELFFMCWYWTSTQTSGRYANLDIGIAIRKEEMVSEHLYTKQMNDFSYSVTAEAAKNIV